MEFKQEELVEREMEIARYLKLGVSMKEISDKTGLSSKHVTAHLNNMRIKLKGKDVQELIKLLNATECGLTISIVPNGNKATQAKG